MSLPRSWKIGDARAPSERSDRREKGHKIEGADPCIKAPDEEVAAEERAVPVGIEGHDEIEARAES